MGQSELPADRSTKPDDAGTGRGHSVLVRICVVLGLLLVGLVLIEFAIRPFVAPDLVGPSAVKYDPYYGKVLKPGYSGPITSNGYRYRLDVNALGFRGPEMPSPPRGSILFLGDSQTFGATVDNDKVYPELIRRRLADRFGEGTFPVVNTAIAGNGQGRWLRFLKRDAEAFEPRLIVMQFCRNDFHDNHRERFYELEDDGSLKELRVPRRCRGSGRSRSASSRSRSSPIHASTP